MKRIRVKSLAQLVNLASARRSVTIGDGFDADPTPAAWAVQWSGERLHNLLSRYGLFIYEPHKPNKRSRWSGPRRFKSPAPGSPEYAEALAWAARQSKNS